MTRLPTIDGELQRPQKSASTISPAVLSLTTSFQLLVLPTTGIDLGNAPRISAMLKWTYGADTQVLTVQPFVSHTGVAGTYQAAPAFGAYTVSAPTATSVVNKLIATYLGSTWQDPDSGAFALCPVEFDLPGWRFCKVYVKSSANAGTVDAASTFAAGTDS